jgi:hypothetical protein
MRINEVENTSELNRRILLTERLPQRTETILLQVQLCIRQGQPSKTCANYLPCNGLAKFVFEKDKKRSGAIVGGQGRLK